MLGFETTGGSRYGRTETLQPTARKIAEKVFAKRPKEKDFVGRTYSKEEVEADLALLKRREGLGSNDRTREDREAKEMADFFEVLVVLGINDNEWMGRGAKAYKTSEYDDHLNKVDMVVEFETGNSAAHLGLAADVTFSSNRGVVTEKFNTVRDRIKRGVLSEVKYFHSDYTNSDHHLTMLPEVVIGLSRRTVQELQSLLANGKHETLNNHKAGIKILKQIEAQLITFTGYATSMHQPALAKIFSHRLGLIQKILTEKAELVAKTDKEEETDPVHLEIMSLVNHWSRY